MTSELVERLDRAAVMVGRDRRCREMGIDGTRSAAARLALLRGLEVLETELIARRRNTGSMEAKGTL